MRKISYYSLTVLNIYCQYPEIQIEELRRDNLLCYLEGSPPPVGIKDTKCYHRVSSHHICLKFSPSPFPSPVATGVTPVPLGEGGGRGHKLLKEISKYSI
jgi:hypothetical protein